MAIDVKHNGYSIRGIGSVPTYTKTVLVFWPKGFMTTGFIQFTSSQHFEPDERVILIMETDSGKVNMNGVVSYTELIDISDLEPMMNVTISYDKERC